jgi:hypothetical protein
MCKPNLRSLLSICTGLIVRFPVYVRLGLACLPQDWLSHHGNHGNEDNHRSLGNHGNQGVQVKNGNDCDHGNLSLG